ncbi:uncharacterized protein LOC116950891 [Petromyzon marinus]|uniref:uncharacterized protein LOC116950891 n=1 Tax=Petromyzon marinus TaxID=7757 RepID=UPI003F712134
MTASPAAPRSPGARGLAGWPEPAGIAPPPPPCSSSSGGGFGGIDSSLSTPDCNALRAKAEHSFFLYYYYRMEDEAVLDRGALCRKHTVDEEDVEGHHAVYIGVHVPCGQHRRRRRRRRTSRDADASIPAVASETHANGVPPTLHGVTAALASPAQQRLHQHEAAAVRTSVTPSPEGPAGPPPLPSPPAQAHDGGGVGAAFPRNGDVSRPLSVSEEYRRTGEDGTAAAMGTWQGGEGRGLSRASLAKVVAGFALGGDSIAAQGIDRGSYFELRTLRKTCSTIIIE